MSQLMSVCEPTIYPRVSRSNKARATSRALRHEVDNMLRDVAFVLAQTRLVREAIDNESAKQPTYNA